MKRASVRSRIASGLIAGTLISSSPEIEAAADGDPSTAVPSAVDVGAVAG